MRNLSNETIERINNGTQHIILLFKFFNGEKTITITNDKIVSESFRFEESLSTENVVMMGYVNSCTCEVEILNETNLQGYEANVVVLFDDGTNEFEYDEEGNIIDWSCEEYFCIIHGFVRQTEKGNKSNSQIITISDSFSLERSTKVEIQNATTIREMISELFVNVVYPVGYELSNLDIPIDKERLNTLSLMKGNLLVSALQLNSCLGIVRYDILGVPTLYVYPWYLGTQRNIGNISPYLSFDDMPQIADYEVEKIDSVILRETDDDLGVVVGETQNNSLIFTSNPLLYGMTSEELRSIASVILNYCKNGTYTPIKCNLKRGLPYMEAGDFITYNNKSYIIFNRVLTGIQAMKDSYSSIGDKTRENEPLSLYEADNIRSATIRVLQDSVAIEIDEEGHIVSNLNITKNGMDFVGDKIVIDTENFSLDEEGNATFSGTITGGRVEINVPSDSDEYEYIKVRRSQKEDGIEVTSSSRVRLGSFETGEDIYINGVLYSASDSWLTNNSLICSESLYTTNTHKETRVGVGGISLKKEYGEQTVYEYGIDSEGINLNGEHFNSIDSELSDDSENPVQNKVIKARLDECFQSVSSGKSKVALAITDKGVPTSATDTFDVMATNIRAIEGGGGDVPTGEFSLEKYIKATILDYRNLHENITYTIK